MTDWEADHIRVMSHPGKAGESGFSTDTVREVTGTEPRTIEAFLDEILVQDAPA